MPHVILTGPLTPEDIWLAFQPVEFREKGNLYKAEAAYLSVDKEEVLVRSLCVERGFNRRFLVRISSREDGIHIGIDSLAAPDKSEGVRRQLGLYAWMILQAEPEAVMGTTDISDFMGEPIP